ncbi:MAG: hypothetical protein GC154_08450 [bacterium]|nr:hypothetical protein [bacterium]
MNKKPSLLVILIAAVLSASCQTAQQNASAVRESADPAAALQKKIGGPVQVANQPVSSILPILEGESGVAMMLKGDCDPKAAFSLDDPTIQQVLDALTASSNTRYEITESNGKPLVVVSCAEKAPVAENSPVSLAEKRLLAKRIDPEWVVLNDLPALHTVMKGPILLENQDIRILSFLLSSEAHLNVKIMTPPGKKTSLNLYDPTVREVLDAACLSAGCTYMIVRKGEYEFVVIV